MSLRRARLAPGRRERIAPALVASVILAGVGVVATVWRPLAPPIPPVDTDLTRFGPEVLAAVRAYREPRYLALAVSTVLEVAVPLLVVVTATGRRWVARLAGPRVHAPGRGALAAAVVAAATSLALLPVAAWAGIHQDGRWGFRTQPALSWLGDWLLVAAGRWAAVAALVAILLAAMRRWPRSWPYRLTLVGSALAAVAVLLHPLVLQPLLLPSEPMPPGPRREAAEAVLAGQGVEDLPLHVGEASQRTTRVNAMVVGIGPTERVVLYDTLLELPGDQVRTVLAHELAHREHRDLLRGVLLVPTLLLPALLVLRAVLARAGAPGRQGARGPTDPRLAAVVLATAAVLELMGGPVAGQVSRRAEAAADHRALEVTGDPVARIASVRAFTVRDLAAPRPPTWARLLHGTHPTVVERIRAAAGAADPQRLPDRDELVAAEREIAHPAVRTGSP